MLVILTVPDSGTLVIRLATIGADIAPAYIRFGQCRNGDGGPLYCTI
jgi:hypothetical protein